MYITQFFPTFKQPPNEHQNTTTDYYFNDHDLSLTPIKTLYQEYLSPPFITKVGFFTSFSPML